jgi:hypothetical protein
MGEWRYHSTIWTSALAGGDWSSSCPGRFCHGEQASISSGPRAGMEDGEKILPCRELNPGSPVCRHTDWAIPALPSVQCIYPFLAFLYSLLCYDTVSSNRSSFLRNVSAGLSHYLVHGDITQNTMTQISTAVNGLSQISYLQNPFYTTSSRHSQLWDTEKF